MSNANQLFRLHVHRTNSTDASISWLMFCGVVTRNSGCEIKNSWSFNHYGIGFEIEFYPYLFQLHPSNKLIWEKLREMIHEWKTVFYSLFVTHTTAIEIWIKTISRVIKCSLFIQLCAHWGDEYNYASTEF